MRRVISWYAENLGLHRLQIYQSNTQTNKEKSEVSGCGRPLDLLHVSSASGLHQPDHILDWNTCLSSTIDKTGQGAAQSRSMKVDSEG